MPYFPQYRRNWLETKNNLPLDEVRQRPSYARRIDFTPDKSGRDIVIGHKHKKGNFEKTGKARDLIHGDVSAKFDEDGNLKSVKGSGGLGTKQLGAHVRGSYNNETGDGAVDVGVNAGIASMNLGGNTKEKSAHVGAQIDTRLFGLEGYIGGSKEYGLVTKVGGNFMSLKGSRKTFAKGPLPNTSRDQITVHAGPEDVFQTTIQIDSVLAAKGHPLYNPDKITLIQSKRVTKVKALGKTQYKEVKISTLLNNGKYKDVIAEKISTPEFNNANQNLNNFVDMIGAGSKIQRAYRDEIVDNLKNRFKNDPNRPSDQAIMISAQRYTEVYGKGLRNIETGVLEAKSIENGLYDAFKAGVSISKNAKMREAIDLHRAKASATIEKIRVANAQALSAQVMEAQKQEFNQRVNIIEHKVAYENLQSELMRAGAPEALLRDVAQGSVATPGGVNPSMAAAMMRGIEGRSVVDDVRYSALDKLAGEHARLEYERTGDAVASTQAGVDAVRAANGANTGQAPLAGLDNAQVAEKAFQDYRENLMQGTLQIDRHGRVTRGSLADKNPNYAGPSHEFSPEDYMTTEQNRQQLEKMTAKRDAKAQQEAPQAAPNAPKTITINVPRQNYVSGQTQQGAQRAQNLKIDTSGFNMDLLKESANRAWPGQYQVTLGDGSSAVGTGAPAATVQNNMTTPKSDFLNVGVQAFPQSKALAEKVRQRKSADFTQPKATNRPSRSASMTHAYDRALADYYGYRSDDPSTSRNEASFNSFEGWMRAARDAVRTGWYGDPTKNPNKPIIETVRPSRAGPTAQDWVDAQKNMDKDQSRQLAQNNEQAAHDQAPQDALLSDPPPSKRASAKEDTLGDVGIGVDQASSTKVTKADKLGESIQVHESYRLGDNAISKARAEQAQQEQKDRQARSAAQRGSRDHATYTGPGSKAARDAVTQISMGETSGRSTGYNDMQDLATALSRSGQHGSVGVSDLTSHGTIRGSQQSNMLAEQDKGLFDDSASSSSSGGSVICTELYRQGLIDYRVYRADQRFGLRLLRNDPDVITGYHFWAKPVVRLMRKSKLFTRLVYKSVGNAWAQEMALREGLNGFGTVRGKLSIAVGVPMCRMMGRMLGWAGGIYPQPDQNKT